MTSRKIPESAVENLVSDLEGKANVSNTVTTDTAQTISGVKTFNSGTLQALRPILLKEDNAYEGGQIHFQRSNNSVLKADPYIDLLVNTIRFIGISSQNSTNITLQVDLENKKVLVPTPELASNDTQAATTAWVRNFLTPTGTIIIWSAPTPPAGYLICDGSAISRTTYARLFNVIGTTWGAGDGNTTFNLPTANDFPTGYPGKYSDIAAGPSGSFYIAPKNGWYSTHCTAWDGDQVYIELVNETAAEFGIVQEAAFNGVMRIFIPAKKGDKIFFFYRNLHSIDNFRFYEDNGQQMIIKY